MTEPVKPFVFSIRAEYARRILAGDKRWEFRKSMPRFDMGDTALIYESRGRGRIVAAFTVGSMIHPMSPADLWRTIETMDPGSHGIGREAFFKYFEGKATGVAFGVTKVVPLDLPLPASMKPPQRWARWKGPWPPPTWVSADDDLPRPSDAKIYAMAGADVEHEHEPEPELPEGWSLGEISADGPGGQSVEIRWVAGHEPYVEFMPDEGPDPLPADPGESAPIAVVEAVIAQWRKREANSDG